MPNSPLPRQLAAFEEYVLRDDRPAYPMGIIARLRFTGRLDSRAGAVAFQQVIARHPLLRAKDSENSSRTFAVGCRGRRPVLPSNSGTWHEGTPPDHLPSLRPIDLFTEPGLRAWATTGTHSSSLLLKFIMLACDGKAVLQLADDFLRCYAANTTDGGDAKIDFTALRCRGTARARDFWSDRMETPADVAGKAQRRTLGRAAVPHAKAGPVARRSTKAAANCRQAFPT